MSDASIALNRFGLGARPDEPAPAQPRRWLLDQFDRFDPKPAPIAALPGTGAAAAQLAEYLAEVRGLRRESRRQPTEPAPAMEEAPVAGEPRNAAMEARRFARRAGQQYYAGAVAARVTAALTTPAPFVERLVHFWANHFAVSAEKLTVLGLAGGLEFEAVRPHVLGRFADLLHAAERHPAMLLYLDQAQSVGPGSQLGARAAARGAKAGLNENLAREMLELHTLGVRTGYAQADVTELARALTGWTVSGLAQRAARRVGGEAGRFAFAPALHEPGTRTILGRMYPQAGEAQARAVLDDLAGHPATAKHIAIKLCRHFAGDLPPPAMVARVEAAFLRSGGDLPTLYRALVESPEAWVGPAKFRTPWDWWIAALRATGAQAMAPAGAVGIFAQLGQPVWRPGSPAGFDDTGPSWAGPDALVRRVEAAERLAARTGAVDARALADKLFPGSLAPATAQAIARAESPGQALALLLVSPDMMRR